MKLHCWCKVFIEEEEEEEGERDTAAGDLECSSFSLEQQNFFNALFILKHKLEDVVISNTSLFLSLQWYVLA